MSQTDFQTEARNPSDLMTPAQAAAMIDAATGDTGLVPDSGEPNAALEQGTQAADGGASASAQEPAAAPAAPAAEDPAKTVILAKDGVHTIGYEKLVEARESAALARQELAAAQAKIDELQAAAQTRAAAGQAPTAADANIATAQAAIDAGIDPEVFGDWSPEAMAKGVQAVLLHGTKPLLARMEAMAAEVAAMKGQLQPLAEQTARSATAAYYDAIYAVHPDANSIAESQQWNAWIESKPGYMQGAMREVFNTGSRQDVIDLFTQFKTENGLKTTPATPQAAAQAAAASAIQAARHSSIPSSLTDIPGGVRGPGDIYERLDGLVGAQLLEAMETMTAEQRETYVNRAA